ncbi:hypothetical protein LSCM1_07427 [Leishmania martiniquensis]|uniref:Uncharacterized protein n=1 Tax=Leishmania martiniquensis TaxID=1580590 RepID=A0A836HJP8_9TRYP|nr:hypothetical protein LSCM1_07427 [Leishmania martiniquensis]
MVSLLALSVHADIITFVTDSVTVTPSGGSSVSMLAAACSAEKSGAGPVSLPATRDASALYTAMSSKGFKEVYVSAMYTAVEYGSLWMWQSIDSLIVLSQSWAPGYPKGDEAVKYAVYSSDLGGLVNVDGTRPLAVGCSYDNSPPPDSGTGDKKDFPWWSILLIVLGVALGVGIGVTCYCCYCCKKERDSVDVLTDRAPVKGEASVRTTGSHEERSARATAARSGSSHSDSESDAVSSTSRSFSQQSHKTSVTEGAPNAKGGVHE